MYNRIRSIKPWRSGEPGSLVDEKARLRRRSGYSYGYWEQHRFHFMVQAVWGGNNDPLETLFSFLCMSF